jgi:hypothetical protein
VIRAYAPPSKRLSGFCPCPCPAIFSIACSADSISPFGANTRFKDTPAIFPTGMSKIVYQNINDQFKHWKINVFVFA